MIQRIVGSGDLMHAQSHADRLRDLIRLDRLELEARVLTVSVRTAMLERIERNRVRLAEIEAAITKHLGY